jgi:hypothetical protein
LDGALPFSFDVTLTWLPQLIVYYYAGDNNRFRRGMQVVVTLWRTRVSKNRPSSVPTLRFSLGITKSPPPRIPEFECVTRVSLRRSALAGNDSDAPPVPAIYGSYLRKKR